MPDNNLKLVKWILKIAVFGEFLGHGIFALQGKAAWLAWFPVFGINNPQIASTLLFLIGIMDIILAIIVLVRPLPLALLWMATWGFFTALIRPIVGEPIWDFFERWANWGAPLALFFIFKWKI